MGAGRIGKFLYLVSLVGYDAVWITHILSRQSVVRYDSLCCCPECFGGEGLVENKNGLRRKVLSGAHELNKIYVFMWRK